MANRLTIYAGAPVTAALDGVGAGAPGQGGDPGSRSGRINAICERYIMVCKAHRPSLTRGEWLALCDVLNGTILDAMSIRALDASIEDSDPEQITRWGADPRALAARVAAMTTAERVAVGEVVESWWRAEGSYDERFSAAGVTGIAGGA